MSDKPTTFESFFDKKGQKDRQTAAEKREKERAESTALANSSGVAVMGKDGVYVMPYEDINAESYTGNVVSWGRSAEDAEKAEQQRLVDKSKMPWVEKYRPENLTDVISHQNIVSTLDKLIEKGSLPHLLFYGPPGTGKTSSALAVARKLNGAKYFKRMVLELNASDDRGIDTVRDKIKEFASARQLLQGGTKLIILDEADSMTRTAQFALRRVMEMYTKTTRFVIIANYVNKIIPALQSRCTLFRFGPLDKPSLMKHLVHVATAENLPYDTPALEAVVRLSRGDMRNCLNIMQACHAAYGKISEELVYQCTGAPAPADVQRALDAMMTLDYARAYAMLQELQREKGLSLIDILQTLHALVLRMNMPENSLAFLLPQLADVERALTQGANEGLQLGAMVGAFTIARQLMVNQ